MVSCVRTTHRGRRAPAVEGERPVQQALVVDEQLLMHATNRGGACATACLRLTVFAQVQAIGHHVNGRGRTGQRSQNWLR
jgi:hypothetical protein